MSERKSLNESAALLERAARQYELDADLAEEDGNGNVTYLRTMASQLRAQADE
jgi:hypothetical protein